MTMKNKILIIHQGGIGDLVLSLPAFYTIRSVFPKYHFEVMGYPRILSLIHNRFYADSISNVDRAAVSSLYREDGIVAQEIKDYISQFDTVFVFGGKSQDVLVKNIKKITGHEVLHIPTFTENADEHVIDFQLKSLSALGFDTPVRSPKIVLLQEDAKKGTEFLKAEGIRLQSEPLIAVHPGSGGKGKNWPVENYLCFIDKLYSEVKVVFLVIEGPAEKKAVKRLEEELNNIPVIFLRSLELPLLAAIIRQCDMYVGNDSGITHIAASLGVATLALFGPTDPKVWGPRGDSVCIFRELDAEQGWKWTSTDEVAGKALKLIRK
jgi:ADP-heptose:LPS heptosyltransferase